MNPMHKNEKRVRYKDQQNKEFKNKLKAKQTLISKMKAHNEKTREDKNRTIIIPNLTQEDEETTRDQAFKDVTKSVARLYYPYHHNS